MQPASTKCEQVDYIWMQPALKKYKWLNFLQNPCMRGGYILINNWINDKRTRICHTTNQP